MICIVVALMSTITEELIGVTFDFAGYGVRFESTAIPLTAHAFKNKFEELEKMDLFCLSQDDPDS
jgi:hypothetical protein